MDIKNETLKITERAISFKGESADQAYGFDLDLYGEIEPSKCKQTKTDRHIICLLERKEAGPYWPRLTLNSHKPIFVKTDFAKWKDEDEEDDTKDSQFGNMDWSNIAGGAGGEDEFVPEDEEEEEES